MCYGVNIPDLIINGLISKFSHCEIAPFDLQNTHNNLRFDVFENGYGFYWVYTENGATYVRPKNVSIQGLPECWLLKNDSTMTIIDHEVSKFIGVEPLLEYDIYENSYGTFFVHANDAGRKIVMEKDAYHPLAFHAEASIWYLDEDYMRYSPHRYRYIEGCGLLPEI